MKAKVCSLFMVLALLVGIYQAAAQLPVISSFSQNGLLVCSNLETGSVASVEWASSLSGPWHTNWAGLDAVTADSNGVISINVPMFYRVRGMSSVSTSAPPGMVLIPGGSFTMGEPDYEGGTSPTTVSAFYMDGKEISSSQWQSLHQWATNHGYGFTYSGSAKATNHPVHTLLWSDCVKWCNARSEQAGTTPVYYTDAALTQVYKTGEVTVYANWTAKGYRLPTEAEWEKAARGGLSGQAFPWGPIIDHSLANYYGSYAYGYDLAEGYHATYEEGDLPYTSPVGSFPPNGYGLYDMAGNLQELCWDWFGTPYLGGSDPHGPATGLTHVLRGGCWGDYAYFLRCAHRYDGIGHTGSGPPNGKTGFRCVSGL